MDFIDIGLIAMLAFAAVMFLIMVRNDVTHSVRMAFLDSTDSLYDYLPGYNQMVFHPRYWGIWTLKGWQGYVLGQLAQLRKS